MAQSSFDYDIAVVGAGAAGLAAARTACDAGLRTIVLEAKDRVGGRAYTESASLGVPFDHGCRWMHSASRNPFVGIARGLGYDPAPEQRIRHVFLDDAEGGGCWTTDEEARDWTDFADRSFDALEAAGRAGRDLPATDVVERTARWSPLFEAWSAMMTSVDLDAFSTLDHCRYVDTKENWSLPEGFGTVVARFGAGLPVTLNAPVTRIAWDGPGVRLETPKGTVSARAAILTASTAVLGSGRIGFTPALPDWKADAIAAVPLGNANKIAFSVRRDIFGGPEGRFSIFSSTGTDAINFQVRPCGELVVAGFIGGRAANALEKAGPAAATALAIERLKALFGADFEKEVTGSCVTAWRGDPYIGGGYSAALPGEAHRRADLATPIGDRLFFAGEATHMDFYSTAHGAYLSGVAAAEAAGSVQSQS